MNTQIRFDPASFEGGEASAKTVALATMQHLRERGIVCLFLSSAVGPHTVFVLEVLGDLQT